MDSSLPNTLRRVFVTEIYSVNLAGSPGFDALINTLDATCRAMAHEDKAGQAWSRHKRYVGYTSYGSVPDLPKAAPVFEDLRQIIDAHVAVFTQQVELNLKKPKLEMSTSWVNVIDRFGGHSGHFHPGSIVSGTFYVAMPTDSGGLLFEDPRLPLMMGAPTRKPDARFDRQFSASIIPNVGTLLLWESWLRHEVPVSLADEPRISISFNYA